MGTGYKIGDNGPSQRMKSNITMCAMYYLHKLQRTGTMNIFHITIINQEVKKKGFQAAKIEVGIFNFT